VEKAAGVEAYGTSTSVVVDEQGNNHIIRHTLAAGQRILVEVTLTDGDDYVGDTAVKSAIAAWATGALHIGSDVYRSKVSGVVTALDGVDNV